MAASQSVVALAASASSASGASSSAVVPFEPGQPDQYAGDTATLLSLVVSNVADTQGSDIVPAQPDDASDNDFVVCIYDCGGPRHKSCCTDTGNRQYPRWVCQPCNGAVKAIAYQVRRNPEHREELANMKRFDPELYKARVRNSRIRSAADPLTAQWG